MESENITPKRTANWTKDEVLLLLQLIDERKKIIKGKFSPELTLRDKRGAWNEVTKLLNDAFPGRQRSREQVEKKWQNVLCKGKKGIYERRRLFNQTGGGPPDRDGGWNDPVVEGVEKILGKDNVTIEGFQSSHTMDIRKDLNEPAVVNRTDDEIILHIMEQEDLPSTSQASRPDVDDDLPVHLPPVTPAAHPLPVLNAGNQELVQAVLQDMRAAYQAQRDAWDTIKLYYQKKL